MNRISIKKFASRYSVFFCILIACAMACTTKEAPVMEQPTALATIKTTLSPIVTPEPTEEPCPVYLGMQMDEMFDAIGPYEVLYWPNKEHGEVHGLHSFALGLADGRSVAVELVELDYRVGELVCGYYYYDADGNLIKFETEQIDDRDRIPVGTDTSFILQDHLLTFRQLDEAYGRPYPLDSTGRSYRYYTEDMCAIDLEAVSGGDGYFWDVAKTDLKTGELVERAFFEYAEANCIVYHYEKHLRLSAFDLTTGKQTAKVVYERDGDTYRLLSAEGVEPIHTDLEALRQLKNFEQIKGAYGEPHFKFGWAHPGMPDELGIRSENFFAYFTDNYGVAEVYLDENGKLVAVAYWNVNAEGEEEFEYYMY